MRSALFAFALGVGWLQRWAVLPEHAAPALAVSGLAAAWAFQVAHRARLRGGTGDRHFAPALVLVATLAALSAGVHWAALRAQAALAESLPSEWEGEEVGLVGIVDGLPQRLERGWRFAFDVEGSDAGAGIVPARISLSWYAPEDRAGGHADRSEGAAELPSVAPGERWRLRARLRRPHGSVNPHGFDVEGWLLDHGLRATGIVSRNGAHQRLAEFAGRPADHVARARARIRERIRAALPDATYAGVIVALAIGDQRGIPQAQWQLFNRTGIGHLVAISGMHVTVFAAFVGALVLAGWRRVPALALHVPAQRAAALLGLLAAGGYVLLAGAQIPAQRTFFMLAAAALALWLGTPGRTTSVLLCSLVAVLLVDPRAVQAAGFWLSFGAVAVILAAGSGRIGPLGSWRTAARTQAAVSVGLAPLTLLLFQQLSLISPLANALAIPVVTFAVVPLALGGIALPFDWPFQWAHTALAALIAVVEPMAALPAAVWVQHSPGPMAMVCAVAGIAALVAPRGFPGRAAALGWLAPAFLWLPDAPAPGTFRLAVLDVGQGLATVVRTASHTLVYDVGPRFNEQADAGARVVVPYLRGEGIRRLDAVVVSHGDIDHSGGLRSVLDALPVERVLTSAAADTPTWQQAARARYLPAHCETAMGWEWDGVAFAVLHPPPGPPTRATKGNDRSCVLQVTSRYGSALLTGDIEQRAERGLVAALQDASGAASEAGVGGEVSGRARGSPLAVAVVVAPHHGSRTSSSPTLIGAVQPAEVVFPVGYRNRFRHPAPAVVERWRAVGARVSRSDRDGAIVMSFGPALEVIAWRTEQRRYWRAVDGREPDSRKRRGPALAGPPPGPKRRGPAGAGP